MPVPDYQRCMLPLLRLARDGQEHRLADVVERLAQEFQLAEDNRRELPPSGQQPRFDNRVGWAKTYLQKAGLLEGTSRARRRQIARPSRLRRTTTSASSLGCPMMADEVLWGTRRRATAVRGNVATALTPPTST